MPLTPSKRARREVGRAATGAVVAGLQRYGPHGVGLMLIGAPTCLLATFAYYVLDVPLVYVGPGAGLVAIGSGIAAIGRKRRRTTGKAKR